MQNEILSMSLHLKLPSGTSSQWIILGLIMTSGLLSGILCRLLLETIDNLITSLMENSVMRKGLPAHQNHLLPRQTKNTGVWNF